MAQGAWPIIIIFIIIFIQPTGKHPWVTGTCVNTHGQAACSGSFSCAPRAKHGSALSRVGPVEAPLSACVEWAFSCLPLAPKQLCPQECGLSPVSSRRISTQD